MLRVSISKRVGDRPSPWECRWREPGTGTQRKKAFPRKLDAEKFARALTRDADRGRYIDPNDGTTVGQYATAWLANRDHRESSMTRMATHLSHITGHPIGGTRLQDLRPSVVQAFAKEKSRTLSATTVRALIGFMRSVLRGAVEDSLIAVVPAPARIQLAKGRRKAVVPLSVPQVRALTERMPARMRALVTVQAGLGLRVGELLALRVTDVDFLRREVRIEGQLHGRTRARLDLKTPGSERVLPLPGVVADALAAYLAEYGPAAGGVAFGMADGQAWQTQTYNRWLDRAADAARLPHVSSHGLRHHYASVLLAAGESVVAVSKRLGHENAALVLSTYGHLLPDSEESTRRAVDEAWGTSCAPGVPRAGISSG